MCSVIHLAFVDRWRITGYEYIIADTSGHHEAHCFTDVLCDDVNFFYRVVKQPFPSECKGSTKIHLRTVVCRKER